MSKNPLSEQDIVKMLSKLKAETSEYPGDLVKARKNTFLKNILEKTGSGGGQDKGSGQPGGDEGQNSGSGETGKSGKSLKSDKPGGLRSSRGVQQTGWLDGLRRYGGFSGPRALFDSGMAAISISPRSLLVFGAVVVLLAAIFLFRNQNVDSLAENNIITMEETATPSFASLPEDLATETPTGNNAPFAGTSSTRSSGSGTTPGLVEDGSPGNDGSGNGNDNGGIPVTGDSSNPTQPTPTQTFSQRPATPTPKPPNNSLAGRLRFIVCILLSGGENCN